MKKKLTNIMLALTLILCSVSLITGCKFLGNIGACQHPSTTLGICDNCSHDVSISLTHSASTYSSPTHTVTSNREYFYKFTGNGENGILLAISTNDNIYVNSSAKIYLSNSESNYVTLTSTYENSVVKYKYEGTLTQGATYYIGISYGRSGYGANQQLGNLSITLTAIE